MMRKKTVHIPYHLRDTFNIVSKVRRHLKGDVSHTPESMVDELCTDSDGQVYESVHLKLGLGVFNRSFMLASHPEVGMAMIKSKDVTRYSLPSRFFGLYGADGIAGSTGKTHKRQRKQILMQLRADKMEKLVAVENEIMDMAVEEMAATVNADKTINPVPFFRQMAFNILSAEFGLRLPPEAMDDFNFLADKGYKNLSNPFIFLHAHLTGTIPSLENDKSAHGTIERMRSAYDQSLDISLSILDKLAVEELDEHEPETLFDELVHYFVQDMAQEKGITTRKALDIALDKNSNEFDHRRSMIMNEANHVIFAGHESSGNLVSWAVHKLASDPELQNTIQEAVAEISDEDIENGMFMRHATMRNFIFELLRMYPSSAFSLPRIVTNNTKIDYTINGEEKSMELKKGTILSFPIISYHMNPDYFPEPEEFRLDRDFRSTAYMPFLRGPNVCPGQNLGLRRAFMSICKLVKKFDFESAQPGDMPHKQYSFGGLSLAPDNSIKLKISMRNNTESVAEMNETTTADTDNTPACPAHTPRRQP